MQYVVIAYDAKDEQALNRRIAARDEHMDGVKNMADRGDMIVGGAILDETDKMIGSVTVVDFPDRQALDAWITSDAYTKGNVWETVHVFPYKMAGPFHHLIPKKPATTA